MSLIVIIFGIILVAITIYIIVYYIYPGAGNNEILRKLRPLHKRKGILTSDITQSKILAGAGSSVMGFFYLLDGDKTSKIINDFTPIMEVENNWHLEIAPSPNGSSSTSARLRVHISNGSSIKEEIVELPSIPRQKWMFIAILRDGRRFDIIYNNEIVASQILEFYPVVISSSLFVGNSGLSGSVIHVIINNRRLTPSEIENERLRYVNTNGTVLEADSISVSLPALKLLSQCLPGLPCDSVTKPPSNNLLKWKSPYA